MQRLSMLLISIVAIEGNILTKGKLGTIVSTLASMDDRGLMTASLDYHDIFVCLYLKTILLRDASLSIYYAMEA